MTWLMKNLFLYNYYSSDTNLAVVYEKLLSLLNRLIYMIDVIYIYRDFSFCLSQIPNY